MSDNETLSAKQLRAMDALLREPTTRAAATAAKVSEATIWRWLAESGFAEAYSAARGRLLEGTLTALQAASTDAVSTLREVMADTTAQPSARVSAARTVLELALRAREELETEERLRVLEAAMQPLPEGVRRTR